ncbi:response regulator [Mucilaginibacter sp. HD30]
MINIVVVEDHPLIRTGLCELLSGQNDMQVVGSAADGQAALALIDSGISIDVILTDLRMQVMGGLELTTTLLNRNNDYRVVILSTHASNIVKQQTLHAGAFDYVDKADDIGVLLTAIRDAFYN